MRFSPFRLPGRPWSLWALAVTLWVSAPFLTAKYLLVTQQLGWYPPEADSIGIPIIGAVFLTIVGFPLWLLLCHRAFRHYPSSVTFCEWSARHQRYSVLITLCFGLLFLCCIWSLIEHIHLFYVIRSSDLSEVSLIGLFLANASGGWALIWLSMRSCFIARKKTTEK